MGRDIGEVRGLANGQHEIRTPYHVSAYVLDTVHKLVEKDRTPEWRDSGDAETCGCLRRWTVLIARVVVNLAPDVE